MHVRMCICVCIDSHTSMYSLALYIYIYIYIYKGYGSVAILAQGYHLEAEIAYPKPFRTEVEVAIRPQGHAAGTHGDRCRREREDQAG